MVRMDDPEVHLGDHLALRVTNKTTLEELYKYAATGEIVEQFYTLAVIAYCKGNRSQAAKRLNIAVRTLQRKLEKWGLKDWGREYED